MTALAISIRPVSDPDLPAAAALFDRVRHAALPWLLEDGRKPERFADSTVGEAVTLAWIGAELAGLVSIYRQETYVHSLYVDLHWQARGVGRALLAAGLAGTVGAARLKCEIGNVPARRFYERLGWREVARSGSRPGDWILYMHPRPERSLSV